MKESRLDGMRCHIKRDHDVITNDKGQMSFVFKEQKIYIHQHFYSKKLDHDRKFHVISEDNAKKKAEESFFIL